MSDLSAIRDSDFRYFDAALLDYFASQTNRFTVKRSPMDVEVTGRDESGGDWRVRLDLRLRSDGSDILVPFIPDLATLPQLERQRWLEFEVADPDLTALGDDGRFLAAYRQNYEGEFVDWPPTEGEPANG